MRRLATTVLISAVLLAGCSDRPRRTSGAPLPTCAQISTALFHVGMTAPRAQAGHDPTTCTFTSTQAYGLAAGTVAFTRPPTDPYQGRDLDDWAKGQLDALPCANGVRGADDTLPRGRTCYERLGNDRSRLTLAGFTDDTLVRTAVEVRVPGGDGAELKAGAIDAARAFARQVTALLGS